jgi:hypothetical protein
MGSFHSRRHRLLILPAAQQFRLGIAFSSLVSMVAHTAHPSLRGMNCNQQVVVQKVPCGLQIVVHIPAWAGTANGAANPAAMAKANTILRISQSPPFSFHHYSITNVSYTRSVDGHLGDDLSIRWTVVDDAPWSLRSGPKICSSTPKICSLKPSWSWRSRHLC